MIGLTGMSDVTPAPINTLPYSEKVDIGFPELLTIYEGGTFPSRSRLVFQRSRQSSTHPDTEPVKFSAPWNGALN